MIGGTGFSITKALKESDQAKIFEKYFNVVPEIGKRYYSLFRADDDPGCRFEWRNDILYFVDNAGYNGKLFFNAIEALRAIGYTNNQALSMLIKGENIIVENKERAVIKANYIDFPEEHLLSQYGLPAEFLNNDPHTLNIIAYDINNNHFEQNCVGYICNQRFKIRTPIGHVTNFERDDIMNVDLLKNYSKDIICIIKAKKESLILEHHVQIPSLVIYNERVMLPNWAIDICKGYNEVIVFMDNDRTGQMMANRYKSEFGFRPVFTEEKHISDLIDLKGLDYGIKKLKECI